MIKTVHIEGMHCVRCQAKAEKALRAVPGVTGVTVDLQAGRASVTTESAADEALREAVANAGFTVTGIEAAEGKKGLLGSIKSIFG